VNTERTPTVSIGNGVCAATITPPSGTILAESGLSQGYSHSVLRDYGTRQLVNTDQATKYSYKVKIINPNKKSESIVRQLNNFASKFKSVEEARAKIREEFDDQVPDNDFSLGYYDGSQQARVWLYIREDFVAMYSKCGPISLWCDGNYSSGVSRKRKREDAAEHSAHHLAKEDESEAIFMELRQKHYSTGRYDTPRLRLWSRMISAGIHDNYDEPPDIPAFSGNKRSRKETLSDCVSGAAAAVVKALQGTSKEKEAAPLSAGVSPIQSTDFRMKNFEQLRYLQSLYNDGILTEDEYVEQKKGILDSLRKL